MSAMDHGLTWVVVVVCMKALSLAGAWLRLRWSAVRDQACAASTR